MKNTLCCLSLVTLLSACATMTPQECQVADWNRVGFGDAVAGKAILLADHQQACAAAKIVPDQPAYMAGYNAGAAQYCTYDKGLEVGKSGLSAPSTCNTPTLAALFRPGYERGYAIHGKQSELDTKQQRVDEIEQQLERIRKQQAQLTPQEVDLLYREKEVLNKEMDLLRKELALL